SYLIADEATRFAVLVDPVLERVERDLKLLRELDLKLAFCLETHVHADHITGTGRLREHTGCHGIVPEGASVACADRFIADGEILRLGNVTIEAIATPGHTGSHMAYLVNAERILSGDALLIRGCGRTDFQSGNAAELYDSVVQHLFNLPDATLVYPAHDYHGHNVSTIGEEKKWNPRFSGRTREQFIEYMNGLELPYPKKIMEALPANERCGNPPPLLSAAP
ncbi:MAG: MBL fold metallo-hydrolase, partial [Gammaproteobacteria bacterium]